MWKTLTIVGTALCLVLSCGKRQPTPAEPAPSNAAPANTTEMKLTSNSFREGQPIPRGYTCDGANVSPPLEWSSVPKSTKTLALIVDDPDAPAGTWVHWVLYNLPAENIGIIESTPTTETLTGGGIQGMNDFKKIGYGGPCPPSGTHRYFFKIYALDAELPLKPGSTKADLENAMTGHVLAQAQLMGTYRKQS